MRNDESNRGKKRARRLRAPIIHHSSFIICIYGNFGMTPPILSLRGVSKIFSETGRIELFRDLDFDLAAGDFVSITGASGVGKSTLLHILGFLEAPTMGRALFRGVPVTDF